MNLDRQLRILLVDDEEIVHLTLSDFLRDSGHRVDDVNSAAQALARLREAEYDLAILDVQMPDMDGFSLLAQIRASWPEIAVVLMTGHGTLELEQKALALGATVFLLKPVKLLELEAAVRKAYQISLADRKV